MCKYFTSLEIKFMLECMGLTRYVLLTFALILIVLSKSWL